MRSKILTVIRREYLERVSKRSFIIVTILTPVLIAALILAPALITLFNAPSAKRIAVMDESGLISPMLRSNDQVSFIETEESFEELQQHSDIDGILVINSNVLVSPDDMALYTREASSVVVEQEIADQVKEIIENIRLKSYNIDNLQQILLEVNADVRLGTYRLDRGGEATSPSTLSYAIGIAMTFILYMLLMMYGQLVMNSIIEEKANRVLEIVVSSIKPSQLMLGKIVGIGLVAVTQVAIWALLLAVLLGCGMMPLLISANVMEGLTANLGLLHGLSMLSDAGYVLGMFGYLMLFLIGGFMFYAAIYAAFGSAVDNAQDAGQLQTIAIFPMILGLVFGMAVVTDPNSTFALIMSIIPFTSPMVMISRIPFGIPAWQIVLSLAVLYASFFLAVWLSAKIYRVGIFMYGKKPSIKELTKWIKYK